MPIPIELPDIGAGDDAIYVSCWLVDPGEIVVAGDRVVEVLIKGITFDIAAPVSGILSRIEKPLDTRIVPGDILGWIESDNGDQP
jgi:pyruvate/2-oxoglutarate dehydrogenase complex dihydrolipoamide acyltransferase (E2) component